MKYLFFINICLLTLIGTALVSCAQNQTISASQGNKPTDTMTFDITKSEQAWKEQLSPEQYYVLREKGTERPYTGKLLMNKEAGKYVCAACGNVLFDHNAKFDSHCGWPSFDREIKEGRITTVLDKSHGMLRTEIMCARCGGHLGHVFDDGPTETGLRYCVNSLSLEFEPVATDTAQPATDTITLGGGCFWCIEAVFQQLDGVISVASGYSGGKIKNPTYKEVCSGLTGHAEVVQITFDPAKTSIGEILKAFFTVHDPTTLNRQGADSGTQYRSAIFYHNAQQKQIAEEIIQALTEQKVYDNPIVTEIVPYGVFYKAEDYHQNYYNDNPGNPYCAMVVRPKVEKFEKIFKNRLKNKAH